MNDSGPGEQRREHFRLPYPKAERPRLVAADFECDVLEVAEGGVRLGLLPSHSVSEGDHIAGKIIFHENEEELIAGDVLRVAEDYLVLQLTRRLSMHRIMVEQAYIRQKYPAFFKDVGRSNKFHLE